MVTSGGSQLPRVVKKTVQGMGHNGQTKKKEGTEGVGSTERVEDSAGSLSLAAQGSAELPLHQGASWALTCSLSCTWCQTHCVRNINASPHKGKTFPVRGNVKYFMLRSAGWRGIDRRDFFAVLLVAS